MFENEDLRNEVMVDNTEEVNFLVIPEDVCDSINEETTTGLNGVLIGAAIAATGIVAYKWGPKVGRKVKQMFNKETNETLEDKQKRLLQELAEVNSKLTSEDVEE